MLGLVSDESDGDGLRIVAAAVALAAPVPGLVVFFEHRLVPLVAGFQIAELRFDIGG